MSATFPKEVTESSPAGGEPRSEPTGALGRARWLRLLPRRRSLRSPAASSPVERRLPVWAWALMFVGVETFYLFILSSGRFVEWYVHTTYYDFLAEGFRSLQLHLSVDPSPELLAKPDPRDLANRGLWMWDVSLHNGKYYLYWGPVPALLLAAVKVLFRMSSAVSDNALLFAFEAVRLVAGALLIERIARRLFPSIRPALVVLAVLVFALANPTPYTLARGAIYEAAILGGQAFLLAGLVFAFDAVCARGAAALPRRALVAAGIFWSLAIGCRASLAPAIALIALVTILFVAPPARGWDRWGRVVRAGLYVGVPLALAVLALLLYNRARFGAWFDFGLGKQLSDHSFNTGAKYLLPNLLSYLVRPFEYSCRFPFLFGVRGMGIKKAFKDGFELPEGYWLQEPVIGVLNGVPWSWFAVAPMAFGVWALVRALRRWWQSRRKEAVPALGGPPKPLLWCLLVFAVAATVGMVGEMTEFMATMRFLNDGLTSGILFCTLGAWMLIERAGERRAVRSSLIGVYVVLAVGTIAMGCLLGFTGFGGSHFKAVNGDLYFWLSDHLSVCR